MHPHPVTNKKIADNQKKRKQGARWEVIQRFHNTPEGYHQNVFGHWHGHSNQAT